MSAPQSPDLLVVGGGPIGLLTALEARREGLTVTVVERRRGPVDKACGEGIMPSALARMQELDVQPVGRSFRGIAYVGAHGHRVSAEFRHGPGMGVRRTVLHDALGRAADSTGVHRILGDARLGAVRPTHVEVDVAGRSLRGAYLVAADGLHSQIRTELGMARSSRRPARYGLRRHWAVEPWSDHVEVHWSPRAELYVTPVDDLTVGVAVLTAVRGRSYDEWLLEFPDVAERIASAAPASALRGAGPLLQPTRSRSAGRVLLVGDAAGYVDALTGEGLVMGSRQARAAVLAIRDDDPASYESAWCKATFASSRLTRGLLRASGSPVVRSRLVPAAQRFPWVFEAAVAVLE